ncbi:hypothetical protein [Demequina litorisediminis]|uniref:Uncharacterized protein n=1 Tax=Demequina litorisediminis TaxID=1849022 RepID=A0ABQ6IE54_9MICO|nr:hypothetical protein [Demequina litorisediminis]GMA36147.1 hypothetical protein GCM10025876_23510 [Demequina litorisediminis]
MTESAPSVDPALPGGRIRFPGVGIALVAVAVVLLPIGVLTLLGTSSRGFFENAPTQASIGALMILIGAVALIGAAVIAGVRAIAQQYRAAERR